jgi:hypothetical protein
LCGEDDLGKTALPIVSLSPASRGFYGNKAKGKARTVDAPEIKPESPSASAQEDTGLTPEWGFAPFTLTFLTWLVYSFLNFCSGAVLHDTKFGLEDFCSYPVNLHDAGLAEGETHL